MVVCTGENGGDTMTDEQRAHDFALKMMEIYFHLNHEMFTSKNGVDKVPDMKKLFEFYDQNYIAVMQECFHHNEAF